MHPNGISHIKRFSGCKHTYRKRYRNPPGCHPRYCNHLRRRNCPWFRGCCSTRTLPNLLQAISLYRGAAFWSVFFCMGQLMTAFDPQVMGNLFAMPTFQKDFGYLFDGQHIISAPWQTGLMMGVPIGQVVGSLFARYPLDWFGRKKTFGACVIGTICCISSNSLRDLLGFQSGPPRPFPAAPAQHQLLPLGSQRDTSV